LAAVSALLLLAGCGGGLVRRGASDDEVAELERRVLELQQQATVNQVEVARLKQEIAELEAELEAARGEGETAAARDLQEPPAAADEPSGTPIELGGGIEESELEEPEPETPVATGVPVEEPLPEDGVEEGPAETAEAAPAIEPASPEALDLYDEGYTLFHQKRYADAEARFRSYLERYPATDLADNAQFWIGECHYARGDVPRALEAFSATVERYPDGNKVPDALLKAGKCLESLDRPETARETYRQLIESFPNAAAAAIARERLQALR
jgi:tol-pal system protein YbgF